MVAHVTCGAHGDEGRPDAPTYAVPMPVPPPADGRRRLLRGLVAAATLVLAQLWGTGVAAADGARPTNFESVIDSVEPDLDQVEVSIVGGDSFVRVRAEPGTEVLVPGYDGEPYLRIAPDGTVTRNERSSATYLNASRTGTTGRLPDVVDSSAPPDWQRIDGSGEVAWHDHRVHWMLEDAPRTEDGVVQEWTVPLTVDGTEVEVDGRLLLLEDRPPWAALLAVGVAALAAWSARRDRARPILLAGAAAVALASSVSWYLASPPGASPTVLPMVLPLAALVLAVVAPLVPAVARHVVLPLASVALLAGWAVGRLGVLWMPTLPGPLPDVVERALTASVMGVAVGVAVAVLVRPGPEAQGSSTRSSEDQSPTPPRS